MCLPVARDSIQFEYLKPDGDYLELELFEDGRLTKFIMGKNGKMDFGDDGEDIKNDIDSINEVVNKFFN